MEEEETEEETKWVPSHLLTKRNKAKQRKRSRCGTGGGKQELPASVGNCTQTGQEAAGESRGRGAEGTGMPGAQDLQRGVRGGAGETSRKQSKTRRRGGWPRERAGGCQQDPGSRGSAAWGRVRGRRGLRRRLRHIPPSRPLAPSGPAPRGEGEPEPQSLVPRGLYLAGGWRGSSPSSSRRRLRVQSGPRRPPASSPSPLPLSPAGALRLGCRGFLVPRRRCLPAPSASSLCLSEAQSGGRHLRSGWERPRSNAPASPPPRLSRDPVS